MKKPRFILIPVLAFIFLLNAFVQAGQPVRLEVAKKAAEFYAERIFKEDLRVCAHELLVWPWGDPAAMVFTLVRQGDEYPRDIFSDGMFRLGAALVGAGREDEGYAAMARVEKYRTVYVGATTGMPSMIKAHAGLPEHVIARALLADPPADPVWIYAGLFRLLVLSRRNLDAGSSVATEIHTGQEVALKDLKARPPDVVPAAAERYEWGPFLGPAPADKIFMENPYLRGVSGVEEGEYKLAVQELNTKGKWVGCSPAAFYNCLKYLESRGRIDLANKGVNYLLEWIAACFQTNPAGGGSIQPNILTGAAQMFRGLGYNSTVSEMYYENQPLRYLEKFAAEIGADLPCKLGGGTGVFTAHSTTGIGYVKQGELYQLIIHDGWKTTPAPVYVKYLGYPVGELAWPDDLTMFHPRGERTYSKAVPAIQALANSLYYPSQKGWPWAFKPYSKNKVKIRVYAWSTVYYDLRGVKYLTEKAERVYPQFLDNVQIRISFHYPNVKPGKAVIVFYVVDNNGNLLKTTFTVYLLEQVVGKWKMIITWQGAPAFTTYWELKKNHTFTSDAGGAGTWSLNVRAFKAVYSVGYRPVYTGNADAFFTRMNGTASMRDPWGNSIRGTWTATWSGAIPVTVEEAEETPTANKGRPAGDSTVVK